MPYLPQSKSDPIRCYTECPEGSDDECGYDGPGWYFWDETWIHLHGPFGTLKECREILNNYCESL